MNKGIKDRWVAALRSGEYEQGRGFLMMGDEFCCLGVLCDLFVKDGLGAWEQDLFGTGGVLPMEVFTWAGLDGKDPIVDRVSLTCMNDSFRLTFPEIADKIEVHL